MKNNTIGHLRSSRSFRRTIMTLLALSGMILAVLGGKFALLIHTNQEEIATKAVNATMADARRIGNYALKTEGSIREIADAIGQEPFDSDRMIALLLHRQQDNPWDYSLCISLNEQGDEVRQALEKKGMEKIFKRLETTLCKKPSDYAQRTNTLKDATKAGWQQPFWSNNEHAMIVSFQEPIKRMDASGKEQTIGVISARMSMNQLNQILNHRDMGSYGYRFMADGDGLLATHPNKELLVRGHNVLDYTKKAYTAANAEKVRKAFREHIPASVLTLNIINQQTSLIRFEPVPQTGWVTGITLVTNELSIPEDIIKTNSLQILSAGVCFLLLAGLALFLYAKREPNLTGLLYLSIYSTAIIASGVLGIWTLQVTMGKQSPYADNCITTMPQIERFKAEELMQAREDKAKVPQFIETGVLVRSARLSQELETIDLYGIIWERIPDGMDLLRDSGIRFPDQTESSFKEEYRTRENGCTIIGWSFKTTIRGDFKTNDYPFDRMNIKLRIRPPRDFSPVVLLPDIGAYKLIAPSAKAMVADNFDIPGWNLSDTYFTLQKHSYGIDYGQRDSNGDRYLRDLVLNLSVGRDWISTFVSVLIPVFVIMAILFSGIYMITNDADKRRLFNFDGMRTSVIGATITVFLIFAVRNARGEVVAQEILYVEKIYFMIYFAILVNIFTAIAITEKANVFPLNYRNGIILRYLYWPCYTTIMYLLALWSFY